MPARPEAPEPLAKANSAFFGALSRLRGHRCVHPDGVLYEARAEFRGAEHRALARFSRSLGLPDRLGDIPGLALRLLDAHGPDRHQDLLMVGSGRPPALRHLLFPAPSFFSLPYSTLLPYDVRGRLVVFGAAPPRVPGREPGEGALEQLTRLADAGGLRFRLTCAGLRGRWEAVGSLDLGTRRPDPESVAIRFNPWNTGGELVPATILSRMRDPAYRGSQTARPY